MNTSRAKDAGPVSINTMRATVADNRKLTIEDLDARDFIVAHSRLGLTESSWISRAMRAGDRVDYHQMVDTMDAGGAVHCVAGDVNAEVSRERGRPA